MYRSFTDRVLGGVCGGIGAALRINPWLVRIVFIALTIASLGLIGLLYITLWWVMPQQSLLRASSGAPLSTLLALILVIVFAGLWAGQLTGWFDVVVGQALFWPVLLLIVSGVFLLQQVRA